MQHIVRKAEADRKWLTEFGVKLADVLDAIADDWTIKTETLRPSPLHDVITIETPGVTVSPEWRERIAELPRLHCAAVDQIDFKFE